MIILTRIAVRDERLGNHLSQRKILRGVLEIKLKKSGYELDICTRVLDKEEKRVRQIAFHLIFLNVNEQ
jgi:hypothetical protein